jgi:hypothetical protein
MLSLTHPSKMAPLHSAFPTSERCFVHLYLNCLPPSLSYSQNAQQGPLSTMPVIASGAHKAPSTNLFNG